MKLPGSFLFLLLLFFSYQAHGLEADSEAWTERPRDILVHMDLLNLNSINSVEQAFNANFYYEIRWQDDSLVHAGPGSLRMELDDIWNPQVQIINQQNIQKTFALQAEVFPDGAVVYRQRVWGTFSQPFALKSFPFDQQTIQLNLVPAGFSPENINLIIEDGSGVASNLSIPDWSVMSWNVHSKEVEIGSERARISMATMSLELQRHPGFYIVKILLPLVLIVLMSWTVFWIDPLNAGPQINVCVTAMLTLIAFRFSMSAMLPPLSLLTKLDWFVNYITFLVFFSLLEAIYTHRLAGAGQLEKARRTDRISRWVFPLFFLLALMDSFYLKG